MEKELQIPNIGQWSTVNLTITVAGKMRWFSARVPKGLSNLDIVHEFDQTRQYLECAGGFRRRIEDLDVVIEAVQKQHKKDGWLIREIPKFSSDITMHW